MNIPGLSALDNVDRIASGAGYIHEHTMEIGDTVIAIPNIGSITVINGEKNPLPLVAGVVIALVGLGLFALNKLLGLIFLAGGVALVVWGLRRAPDVFLAIGTSDGRRTHIVSKDRKFLLEVRKFLRDKIDRKDAQTGAININNGTISVSGGIAVGDNAQATGAAGDIRNA